MRNETLWQRAPRPPAADELEEQGVPGLLAELLARRGATTPQQAESFLSPDVEDLYDPFRLLNMEAAVERLLKAREAGRRVAVVGDYDVDGVSATALLQAAFSACGLPVSTILPHRMEEGYGFQPVHVEKARGLDCSLVVTADCGTTAREAVAAAQESGMEVIVTDHHIPDGPLPGEALQINPKIASCSYPFDQLSGAGLAFKLAMALGQRCGRSFDPLQLLRVACLGTIADIVPLVDENRVIAALGLQALSTSRSPGLRALIHQAGVKGPVTATDVGFRLGPRLNAAGRLGSADEALELLLCREPRQASILARRLDDWNRERQREEQQVVEEARAALAGPGELPPVLVAWSEGWHRGVVGIAAGRLARELGRPTLLLAVDGETATGSGRSIPAVDLHAFLLPWREELERFGGHA
ncbi:MAG: single-stranded-DNA-specific exonuclease RecJ, partial [Acidobacteria bacterium]|nr:single-stranded-DNA-specific exonuclease RecJ [Acidobacteriota bacterium]